MKLLCRNTRAWVANKKEAQVERAFVVSCGDSYGRGAMGRLLNN